MILIVSNDAGGAELISNWIYFNKKKNNFIFCLTGPAISIFKKNIGNFENIKFSQIKKKIFSKIITGTSWESDIEKKAIWFGRNNKIKTSTYLDHWNNYIERFQMNGRRVLPDQIIVTDKYAFEIAQKKFKNIKVLQAKNFYKLRISKSINNKNNKNNKKIKKILYLTEPLYQHAKNQFGDSFYWGYDEFTLVNDFFSKISLISKKKVKIIVRLHPSEKISKYKHIISSYKKKFSIEISNYTSLGADLNRCNIVVGNQSMAMVMALYAKKKVYSILPNLKFKDLPHKNIKYI